jgi:positive regulator of sigma E activity
MEVVGKVTKTNKERATVFIEGSGNCESCELASFCRIDKQGREIICKNDLGAVIGDIVTVETGEKKFVFAISLNFVFPLIFLVLGVVIGKKLWRTELLGFLAGLGLTFLYFIIFLFVDKKLFKSGSLLPEIISIKKTEN